MNSQPNLFSSTGHAPERDLLLRYLNDGKSLSAALNTDWSEKCVAILNYAFEAVNYGAVLMAFALP